MKTEVKFDLSQLKVPPKLNVLSIEQEDYTNSYGEPALRIRAVLAENTDVSMISGEDVGELKASIREYLQDHRIYLFPYVFLEIKGETIDEESA